MASRIQKRAGEARFRPSNAVARRIGPPSTLTDVGIVAGDGLQSNDVGRDQEPSATAIGKSSKPVIDTALEGHASLPLPKRSTRASFQGRSTSIAPAIGARSTSSSSNGTSSYATAPLRKPSTSNRDAEGRAVTPFGSRATPVPSFGPARAASRPPPVSSEANRTIKSQAKGKQKAVDDFDRLTTAAISTDGQEGIEGARKVPRGARPRPAPSSFVLFSRQRRPQLEREAATPLGARFDVNVAVRTEWKTMSEQMRWPYEEEARKLRQHHAAAMRAYEEVYGVEEKGRGASEARQGKRSRPITISDDEAEYHDTDVHDRLDVMSTSMADLSELRFRHGRASKNTFTMERRLREQKRERVRMRKRLRTLGVRTEEEAMPATLTEATTQDHTDDAASYVSDSHPPEGSTAGESGVEEDNDDEDGNAVDSEAESVGATSTSTHHTLRQKKYSVKTRIVDGKIVLDESSLQQSRNDASIGGGEGELVDVEESDRFVNSATHAKRRPRNDRWQKEETRRFLEAVSMWGSDFEMIARMFPHRDRRQIRTKWRAMERTDSHSLDLAFRRKLPVDLISYGQMAGVDLSGEAPKIEARSSQALPSIKGDEQDETGHDDDGETARPMHDTMAKAQPPIEYDENGLQIVDEGDDLERAVQPSVAARRSTRSKSSMPPPEPLPSSSTIHDGQAKAALATNLARRRRSVSISSSVPTTTTSHTVHGASSAAASDRQRRQKQQREQERQQRERARRRPAPTGEEEVVDETES